MSVTNDEFWHIPIGLWNLTTGQFHYDTLNPPGARVLAVVPVWLAGASLGDVEQHADKESRGDAFVKANSARFDSLLLLARLASIGFSLGTAVLLADWAFRIFGSASAMLVTALWCLEPNVLAHASLATTDMAATFFMLAVLRCAWSYSQHPSWRLAWSLGAILGMSQLVKYTSLLLMLLVPATIFVHWWKTRVEIRSDWRAETGRWVVVTVTCILVINMGYLFNGFGRELSDYRFSSSSMLALQKLVGPLAILPVPLPADYLRGIDLQRHIMDGQHPTYLDGEWTIDGGFRAYYFEAIWYKLPHATQILCFAGLLLLPRRRSDAPGLKFVLVLPVILLFSIATMSSMQLGLRYILPILPFLFLLASELAVLGRKTLGVPQLTALLLGLSLFASLRFHPHHLTYFNTLAGGPAEGHLHLLDSNIDWGQGLTELREYAEQNGHQQIYLAYFGAVNPADIGIDFQTPPNISPGRRPQLESGTYVVSKNFLHGRTGMVRDADGTTRPVGPYEFAYFRSMIPVAEVANCMVVFEIAN